MTNFAMFKLMVDIGLMGSLLYLCYRFLRAATPIDPRRVKELEGSLRRLIVEAEGAGRELTQELSRQKQELDRTLNQVEGAKLRAQKRAVEPEERTAQESEDVARADAMAAWLAARPAESATETAAAKPATKSAALNIFGEPVGVEPQVERSAPAKAARASKLDIEVAQDEEPSVIAQPNGTASMREIYTRAEEMLRAGRDMEYVAARTKLSLGEIGTLAGMIEKETVQTSAKGSTKSTPARASGMRREIHTV